MTKKYYIEKCSTAEVMLSDGSSWGYDDGVNTPKDYGTHTAAETAIAGLDADTYKVLTLYIVD